jgi:hypothetical protein
MTSKNYWSTPSLELINSLKCKGDIENPDNDRKINRFIKKGSIFNTLTLILNVYASEDSLYDSEYFSIAER